MSNVFEGIMRGANEALEYARGNLPDVRVDKITVNSTHIYTGDEVKAIRTQQHMTQKLFAKALGVSVKTVEAWESGVNTPSGAASRVLEMLSQDNELFEKYAIVARQ